MTRRRPGIGIGLAVVVLLTALAAVTLSLAPTPEVGGPDPVPEAGGGAFPTLPPGAVLPTEQACARAVQRDEWEPRPENDVANATVVPGHVASRSWGGPGADELRMRVTGSFTGTTDELIQWASCKWGFSTDITRAQALQESGWVQSRRGDGGVSFGLMQIKSTIWTGTAPWSADSTAYNLDWSLGLRRACFEGFMYGDLGSRGDLWGCIGAHFSGDFRDPEGLAYVESVRRHLAEKAWLTWPGARGGSPPTPGRTGEV